MGLSLALHAAEQLPQADITVFDARPLALDVSRDPRTLALSLGSVHLLRRLQAWDAALAQPILEVHVSQQPASSSRSSNGMAEGGVAAEPAVHIRARDEGVEMLGAVLAHGQIVAALQAVWTARVAREPLRLHSRFGTPVVALKNVGGTAANKMADGGVAAADVQGSRYASANANGVEIDAGIVDRFDLAVVAEGGVFNPGDAQPRAARVSGTRRVLRHDYEQTAWVGQVVLEGAAAGTAFERFTRAGPVALLPLPGSPATSAADGSGAAATPGRSRAALVWCVASGDDPVRDLDAAQRIALLNTVLHPAAGRVVEITPLKSFALGLNAERRLVDGRCVRIGNAAQTLHPVAGQGLNLGLRDAFELVRMLAAQTGGAGGARRGAVDLDAVLQRLERRRAVDRWSMMATTHFLARSFAWPLPGLAAARGAGLVALQAAAPLKSWLVRQMMFGRR